MSPLFAAWLLSVSVVVPLFRRQRVDQDAVFGAAKLDPELGRGCYAPELAVALKRVGFNTTALDSQWTTSHPP